MARPKAACGTYSAYKRHLREKSKVCGPCEEAQRARSAEVSANRKTTRGAQRHLSLVDPIEGAERAQKVAATTKSDDLSAKSRLEVLRIAQSAAALAIQVVIVDEPAKIAPLLRETREIAREIAEIEAAEANTGGSFADQLAAAAAARKARA